MVGVGSFLPAEDDSTSPPLKQQAWSAFTEASSLSSSTPQSSSTVAARSTPSFFQPQAKKFKSEGGLMQMKLCGNSVDPNAAGRMNVAIADILHSHCLPISLANDPKLAKIIKIARTLGPNYKPPYRDTISGKYLNALYSTYWTKQMKTLVRSTCVWTDPFWGWSDHQHCSACECSCSWRQQSICFARYLIVPTILPRGGRRMCGILTKFARRSLSRLSLRSSMSMARSRLESLTLCSLMERVTSRMRERYSEHTIGELLLDMGRIMLFHCFF